MDSEESFQKYLINDLGIDAEKVKKPVNLAELNAVKAELQNLSGGGNESNVNSVQRSRTPDAQQYPDHGFHDADLQNLNNDQFLNILNELPRIDEEVQDLSELVGGLFSEDIWRENLRASLKDAQKRFKELNNSNDCHEDEDMVIDELLDEEMKKLLRSFKYIKLVKTTDEGLWQEVLNKSFNKFRFNIKDVKEFYEAFEEVTKFIKHFGNQSRMVGVRICLTSDQNDSGIFISFRNPSQYSAELILTQFLKVSQSNDNYLATPHLRLFIDRITNLNGGAAIDMNALGLDKKDDVIKKRSIMPSAPFIKPNEQSCFLVSVCMKLLKYHNIIPPTKYRQMSINNIKLTKKMQLPKSQFTSYYKILRRLMNYILKCAQLDFSIFTNKQPGINEFEKIQKVLSKFKFPDGITTLKVAPKTESYRIVIFNNFRKVIFYGTIDNSVTACKKINLVYVANHYNVIESVPGAFCRSYFCDVCNLAYNNRHTHKNCINSCSSCFSSPPCVHDDLGNVNEVFCEKCLRMFFSETCFSKHEKNSTCKNVRYCADCGNLKKSDHVCGMFRCKKCETLRPLQHSCKIPTFQDKDFRIKDHHYIFFDLETRTEPLINKKGEKFVVNLCVCEIICEGCINENSSDYECNNCGKRQRIFEGDEAVKNFLNLLITMAFTKRLTVISHFGSSFDSIFVLREILKCHRGKMPQVTANGTKLFLIQLGNIRIIDSCNFMPAPLADLPKMWGFSQDQKGFFCHAFNKKCNEGYIGSYPDISFYEPDAMSCNQRLRFLSWYEEVKDSVFDFNHELLKYCKNDVYVLRRACVIFTLEMRKECGFCVFQYSTTIAGAVLKIYRKKFYKVDSLTITPACYRMSDKQSMIAIVYLKYMEREYDIIIQSAFRGQEKVITCTRSQANHKVDGYFEKNGECHVIEFQGCVWHQHENCGFNNNTNNKNSKRFYLDTLSQNENSDENQIISVENNLALRREATARKIKDLRDEGFIVHEMYECEFKKILDQNPGLEASLRKDLDVEPLKIRESFAGGSVDCIFTYKKAGPNEELRYLDFNSLYPSILRSCPLPFNPPKRILVGHEECSKENLHSFDGFIKCTILPPKNLMFPVLPSKINNKLMFVLCRSCAIDESTTDCLHTDDERALTGVFVSVEFKLALTLGYRIIKLYELQEFELRDDLFGDFIQHFYTKKIVSSPKPSNVDKFITEYFNKEGILLKAEDFEDNPARRALSKLMLNSLWGKLAETVHKRTILINDPAELFKLIQNPAIDIKSTFIINSEILLLTYDDLNQESVLNTTSLACTSFITAYGRFKLHSQLQSLGSKTCYFDTDSIIYLGCRGSCSSECGGSCIVDQGEHLGQLKNELTCYGPRAYGTEFTGAGPKSYGLKIFDPDTETVSEICKVKGITLNHQTKKLVNFNSLFCQANFENPQPIKVINNQFVRDKDLDVRIIKHEKIFRAVINKRRKVGFQTVPYGFDLKYLPDK